MAPGPNGTLPDLLKNSVTEGDAEIFAKSPGVWFFSLPTYSQWGQVAALPAALPYYWCIQRDVTLRATVLHESLWASAVAIAGTKAASQSWDVEGEGTTRLKRAQEMMLGLDGRGWVPGQSVGVRDYLTTDNGEWWEIVRSSSAAGSRVLGLMHLDSVRCLRTGDPDRPIVYLDLMGRYHELRDYQVIELTDSPHPGAEWLGVGLCAASRAYPHIYEMAGIQRYVSEKVHGDTFKEIHFVNGINDKMLSAALESAQQSQQQKGFVYYRGAAVIPMFGDKPVSGYRVPISELPDKFDRKQEWDLAVIAYADAIGLDPQDLQPLSGQGLGTGAQSWVLMEKAKGKGLAARRKQWIHEINLKVLPDAVTFVFHESDLDDEKKQAEVTNTRAGARGQMIQNGEITALEARQLAVDSDDLPKEFTPPEGDLTPEGDLSDEEKPLADEEQLEALPLPDFTAPGAGEPDRQSKIPVPRQKEFDPNQPRDDEGKWSETGAGDIRVISEKSTIRNKSINEVLREYEDTLDRWVVDAANGNMDAKDVARAMRALIREKGPAAFTEGLREGGIPDVAANLTDEDESQVDDWIKGQLEYVTPFAKDAAAVAELTGDAQTAARNALLGRVDEWRNSLQAIGQKGYLAAKGNPMLTFDGEDGEESCKTCRRYKGQRHRRTWWEARGLLDRPNGNYECGRFDPCQHHFYDSDGNLVMD